MSLQQATIQHKAINVVTLKAPTSNWIFALTLKMKKILFWTYFVNSLFCHSAHDIIDSRFSNLVESQSGIKCGTISNAGNDGGRIINGKPVTQPYPWLFQILRRRRRREEKGSLIMPHVTTGFMGSLITARAIVTCKRCICDAPITMDPLTIYGCQKGRMDLYPGPNQIIHGKNDILAIYFENELPADNPNPSDFSNFFDNHLATQNNNGLLQAYIYRSRSVPPDEVRTNGDVGIIILPRPAAFVWPEAIPICLPNPDILHLRTKLKTVVAGPGPRYHETNNTGSNRQTNTSCITNYGMKKFATLPKTQRAFLPCRKHDMSGHRSNSYCTKLSLNVFPKHMSENVLHAVSTSIQVKFEYENGPEPKTFQRTVAITELLPKPTTYRCDILWPKVKTAIEGMRHSFSVIVVYLYKGNRLFML